MLRVLFRANPGDLFFTEGVGLAHPTVLPSSPPPSAIAKEGVAAFLYEYAAGLVGEVPSHSNVILVRRITERKTIDSIASPAEDSIE
jgi:hypothetical protein